jgi:hypothetical protein
MLRYGFRLPGTSITGAEMLLLRFWLAAALLLMATLEFGSVSTASAGPLGDASARLNTAMTEQQVVQTVGSQPDKVEMKTCGSATKQPWTCRTYTFKSFFFEERLIVFFRQAGGAWVVNSWSVL